VRYTALIFALLLINGCRAHARVSQAHPDLVQPIMDAQQYESVGAMALVFDPPVTASDPAPDLSRDGRQASAFVGYDDPITTFFYVRTDDRWRLGHNDDYERRAVIERSGVSYR